MPHHRLAAALALIALPWAAAPLASPAEARAPRGAQQMSGTWDATWQNSRGAQRKGLIVVEQRGNRLSARIESHGNVTATGTVEGSNFTLRGSRMGVPFTITGRVKGRKLAAPAAQRDDIGNAGGSWKDREVVIQGNWLTCRSLEAWPEVRKSLPRHVRRTRVSARSGFFTRSALTSISDSTKSTSWSLVATWTRMGTRSRSTW